MADIQQFPSENGVSPAERGASTQPVGIVQTTVDPVKKNPWSKYVPFEKGTELIVAGTVRLGIDIPFSGVGRILELTDSQLEFSLHIPVEIPLPFVGKRKPVDATAKITYVDEGGKNPTSFTFANVSKEQRVSIQSTESERILTPPGGLELPTGLNFLEKVTLKEVRLIRSKDQLQISVGMASPVPDFTVRISKK